MVGTKAIPFYLMRINNQEINTTPSEIFKL
jgi:hypothetical protein